MALVILGAGGHAKAVQACFGGVLLTEGAEPYVVGDDKLTCGVGDPERRKVLWDRYPDRGWPNLISATIATLGMGFPAIGGCQMMPGAIVMNNVTIGKNVLINTGAQIDHDCVIGDHCHIAPGAVLCGNVTLGERVSVGANATIVQGVTIDAGTRIPAGSLVVGPHDIREARRVVCGN